MQPQNNYIKQHKTEIKSCSTTRNLLFVPPDDAGV